MADVTYVVVAEHPRRGGPVVVTNKAGRLLGVSGEVVRDATPDEIASMLRQCFIVPVEGQR